MIRFVLLIILRILAERLMEKIRPTKELRLSWSVRYMGGPWRHEDHLLEVRHPWESNDPTTRKTPTVFEIGYSFARSDNGELDIERATITRTPRKYSIDYPLPNPQGKMDITQIALARASKGANRG